MWFNALRLGFDFQPVFQLLALSLPGSIVQQRKLSMLAEFTCESFNRTVLPFTLEAKGTEPPVTSSCAKISVSLNSHNVQIEDLSGLSRPTQITIL